MPRKLRVRNRRKHRYYRRKKRYYKRRRSGLSKVNWFRIKNGTLLPDMLFTKLKYNGRSSSTATSPFNTQIYSINSLFDPDQTATGHQPLGFDEWASFYARYEVKASRIRVRIHNVHNANAMETVVYPSQASVPVTTLSTTIEQPYSRRVATAGTNSKMTGFMTNYIGVKKLMGRNIDSVNFTASTTANPAHQVYWVIYTSSLDGSTNVDMILEVDILYYCRFYQRNSLESS